MSTAPRLRERRLGRPPHFVENPIALAERFEFAINSSQLFLRTHSRRDGASKYEARIEFRFASRIEALGVPLWQGSRPGRALYLA